MKFVCPVPAREPSAAVWAMSNFGNETNLEISRFALACNISHLHHEHLYRKSGQKYHQHDCRVVGRIITGGFDITTATSAYLHDFGENDGFTREYIASIWGEKIAFLVYSVTKKSKLEFRRREARMCEAVMTIIEGIEQDYRVAILKGADKLDNMTDTAGLNEEDEYRLFFDTEVYYLPTFRWAIPKIPQVHHPVFRGWILEMEFACDNYWRRQNIRARYLPV